MQQQLKMPPNLPPRLELGASYQSPPGNASPWEGLPNISSPVTHEDLGFPDLRRRRSTRRSPSRISNAHYLAPSPPSRVVSNPYSLRRQDQDDQTMLATSYARQRNLLQSNHFSLINERNSFTPSMSQLSRRDIGNLTQQEPSALLSDRGDEDRRDQLPLPASGDPLFPSEQCLDSYTSLTQSESGNHSVTSISVRRERPQAKRPFPELSINEGLDWKRRRDRGLVSRKLNHEELLESLKGRDHVRQPLELTSHC